MTLLYALILHIDHPVFILSVGLCLPMPVPLCTRGRGRVSNTRAALEHHSVMISRGGETRECLINIAQTFPKRGPPRNSLKEPNYLNNSWNEQDWDNQLPGGDVRKSLFVHHLLLAAHDASSWTPLSSRRRQITRGKADTEEWSPGPCRGGRGCTKAGIAHKISRTPVQAKLLQKFIIQIIKTTEILQFFFGFRNNE